MLSGVNPAQSKINLTTWLEAIIYRCSATSLVLDIDGNREHALFHHLRDLILIKSLVFSQA